MYRFSSSAHPVANPLQGLIGLGAVTSYYRTPTYSCTESADVVAYAKHRCESRSPSKVVNENKGYNPNIKGTRSNPYSITIRDLYQNMFDSCRVKNIKTCAAKPPTSQPVVVNTPDELVVIPIPQPYPAPVRPLPVPPATVQPAPVQPMPEQHPAPIVVTTPNELVQHPVPIHPVNYRDESTPVMITSLPPPSRDPLDDQMLQEVTRTTKAGIIVEPPEPPIIEVEPEDSDTSKYVIGGILLLLVGGGATYYFMRKKKR